MRAIASSQLHVQIISFVSFIFFAYGVYHLFLQIPSETNSCSMTYTRGPSYKLVTHVKSELNYKYKLYRFDQVSSRKHPSDSSLEVSGIPVLFIPGHLGDYKQVRSLGSLADELGKRETHKLEYFTLDFREEASAFSTVFLEQQSSFMNDAITAILELYQARSKNQKSVVIVGHSMGGFVARRALLLPNYNKGTVKTIITLSSPHVRAPHVIDQSMASLWTSTNFAWEQGRNYNFITNLTKLNETKNIHLQRSRKLALTLGNITLFSVSGGRRDNLIDSKLSSVKDIIFADRGFSVLTKDIPGVDISVDHMCQVWCKQLMHAITSGLYEAADDEKGRMEIKTIDRVKAMSKHLLPKEWFKNHMLASLNFQQSNLLRNNSGHLLTIHDHVLSSFIDPETTTITTAITNVVRRYGSTVLTLSTAIIGLSLGYQVYVFMASTSKHSEFPPFRDALNPPNHLLHVIVGIMCSWYLGHVNTSKTIQLQVATIGSTIIIMLSILSTTSFLLWLPTPVFIQSSLNDIFSFVQSLNDYFLSSEYPPFYIFVGLYFTSLSFITLIDMFLDVLQNVSTFISEKCFKPMYNCLPQGVQKVADSLVLAFFSKRLLCLLFSLLVFLISCVVSPAIKYENNRMVDRRVVPSVSNLTSLAQLSAATLLAMLSLITLFCILIALSPEGTTSAKRSKGHILRGFLHLVLFTAPLQVPNTLLSIDILRTETMFVSWDLLINLIVWRLPFVAMIFFGLYTLLISISGPIKCENEERANLTQYKIGNEIFEYDYRYTIPDSVSRGMRLAYWRVAQMEKLDKIFDTAINIKGDMLKHRKNILSWKNQNNFLEKKIEKKETIKAQKVHKQSLYVLDKFQKLQDSLDEVSSVPTLDGEPPCAVVKGRRKAMQKEVIKQLNVADDIKKITENLALKLEKILETQEQESKMAKNEEKSNIVDFKLPIIPDLDRPPISPVSSKKSVEKTAEKIKENKGDVDVYFSSDQYDTVTGTMLFLLIFCVGFANFAWNFTTMYNSTYPVSLSFFLIAFHSY